MEFKKAYAMRIIQLLKENNISTYRLSSLSGIPHSTLSMILTGATKNPRSLTTLNVCRGLDISLANFYDSPLFSNDNLDDD